MKRLSDRWMFYCGLLVGMNVSVEDLKHIQDLIDAEEQGLLLKLPTTEGTTVYMISNNTDCCYDCDYFEKGYYECEDECRKLDDRPIYPQYAEEPICEKQFLEVIECKPNLDWIFNSRKSFGKTVFLTRQEVEAKLRELKGEVADNE